MLLSLLLNRSQIYLLDCTSVTRAVGQVVITVTILGPQKLGLQTSDLLLSN